MSQATTDEKYMRRCLQLAECGRENAKPNPMVGAVIVAENRIIGEGYHVRYGEAHAEVNAFASISPKDAALLPSATLYVSLEPCAHQGKTPPCTRLIIEKGVGRVVVGCIDPFAKVQGRGIRMLQEAGIEVTLGVLEAECLALNRRFIVCQHHCRPYIILKWAQTTNGFLDDNNHAMQLSTPFTRMLVHQLRADVDAILIGRHTDEREHPALTVRDWSGKNPRRIVLTHKLNIHQLMNELYTEGVQSLLVEGGATAHQSFLNAGLWDEIRVETAPVVVTNGTKAAPLPKNIQIANTKEYDGNLITSYIKTDGLQAK